MEIHMDTVNTIGKAELPIREILSKDWEKGKEPGSMKKEINTKDNF